MGEPLLPIVAEITIARPIERVWDVLTGQTTVPQWLGAIDYRPEVGTTFLVQLDPDARRTDDPDGATHCDVKLLQPPHKFSFSWYVPGTPETLVEFSLDSDGPADTLVRVLHEGWDDFEREAIEDFYEDLAASWQGDVLPALKSLAESG